MILVSIIAAARQMESSAASSKWEEDRKVGRTIGLGQLAEDFAQECAVVRSSSFSLADCQVRSIARRVILKTYGR